MFKGWVFTMLSSPKGSAILASIVIGAIGTYLIAKTLNLKIRKPEGLIKAIGNFISTQEKRYHRDVAIGKLTEKRMKVKAYKFLNDLVIDLGLKNKGVTPYEFLFLVSVSSFIVSVILGKFIFGSFLLGMVVSPITFIAVMCGLYTRANIAHDARIEAIIEAENIISNNIKEGVVVAVRNSLDMIPPIIRQEFMDFLDNIEHKNFHIRTALLELGNSLGSVADDFIKKCIVFEMEEEHGLASMFKDVVEINNIKTKFRTEMKRKFEEVSTEFVIGALMIFVFLGGTMAIFENVANFYLRTFLGQLILVFDLLILVAEFVYITYLRAKEL